VRRTKFASFTVVIGDPSLSAIKEITPVASLTIFLPQKQFTIQQTTGSSPHFFGHALRGVAQCILVKTIWVKAQTRSDFELMSALN